MAASPFEEILAGSFVRRGQVTATHGDGSLTVAIGAPDSPSNVSILTCDVLRTSREPVDIGPGAAVLVAMPHTPDERGVVIGAIGITSTHREPSAPEVIASDGSAPDTLVLEARSSLTLRVGEGSITIRADGKILIKGTDLVSHAKRTNRIKGGAVSIN